MLGAVDKSGGIPVSVFPALCIVIWNLSMQ